jgi:WD repeat-containing protein 76
MSIDFEALRAKTAADNAGLLTKTNNRLAIVPAAPPKPTPRPRPSKKSESIPPPTTRATRSSRRLAEANGDKKHKLDDGLDQSSFQEAEPKRMRIEGDLDLGSIAGKSGLDGLQNVFRGAQPGLRTFEPVDVVDSITDEASKSLIKRFDKFRLYEKFPGPGTWDG